MGFLTQVQCDFHHHLLVQRIILRYVGEREKERKKEKRRLENMYLFDMVKKLMA